MMGFYEQHYCGNEQRDVADFQFLTLHQTLFSLKWSVFQQKSSTSYNFAILTRVLLLDQQG